MGTERSDKVFEKWHTSSEKFDYFILGLLGALCAYIANKFSPSLIGLNPQTVEVVSLFAFLLSTFLGFKRIEYTITLTDLNHQLLRAKEEKGILKTQILNGNCFVNTETGETHTPISAANKLEEIEINITSLYRKISAKSDKAQLSYLWRDRLILIGFMLLIGSKMWTPYFS
ncbi:hypothetical protein [Xanthomonas oryzae]|uniref:hypothetical protein n=1 Tax=Xanthomonas oryzae TaxID=347 RepID=UPI0012B15D86|nr:hypothetical protein [Xanthomonas oryzae]